MKKILSFLLFLSFTIALYPQVNENKVGFELGKGLNIQLDNGMHLFNIGGYLQMDATYSKYASEPGENRFGIQRGLFNIGGDYYHDKFGFMLQLDFADPYPLLDAWMSYKPVKWLKLSAGQKQSLAGPRSMLYDDQALNLGNRSLVNQTFFETGRELGLFVETRNKLGSVGIDLGVSVTRGDGRNSFGSSSTDFDLGGANYSARATLYPLGFFTGQNDLRGADFAREKTVKIALGVGYSYNDGVSNPIGQGHGDFILYDSTGTAAYPDYQKLSVDLLLKYRGFSFLAEYVNAVGNDLQNLYTAPSTNSRLQPKQIADYLRLGNGFTVETGYLFKNKWAVDLRYSTVCPEWDEKNALIEKASEYTAGISKYIIDNRLKLQLAGTYLDLPEDITNSHNWQAQFLVHVVF